MREEIHFWRRLGDGEAHGEHWGSGWESELAGVIKGCEEGFQRERKRSEQKFGEDLITRVERARERRLAWAQETGERRRREKKDRMRTSEGDEGVGRDRI